MTYRSAGDVLTGIDVLERDGFSALRGRRVGLVTNHTGLDLSGRATVDILHEAPGVTLAALFGPEHGIRGEYDEKVADSTDAKTGLPVYSLYGERYKPTPEQLQGLDTLVYDIQDVGCRFYTYSSTLGHIVEAGAENGLSVLVLDRPNPITGEHVEGPLADADKFSFIAYYRMPVRHGMTVGEMARLFNGEKQIGCAVDVIACAGWRRQEWFDATGLTWTNPSPNMRSLTEAAVYPGIGLLEFTNVSVGRGTDTPFEVLGAPYIDARQFAAALNSADLPGVRFIPRQFTPKASVQQGNLCHGVNILVTDRDALNAVQVGMVIALTLRRLYPSEWTAERFLRLLANQKAFDAVVGGQSYAEIAADWEADLQDFRAIRGKYLLYE